jgi:Helix-turn-helix domain
MKKVVGKEKRFFKALASGKTISRKQAMSQYKLGNPSATVLRIVQSGETVKRQYSTKKVKGNFITTVKYSLVS